MILSASRRTDIPCYYGDWLINRLRAGYVLTRNPMNHAQLGRISLKPETTDCIVFWTKDPQPLIPLLKSIDDMGYNYYFQFTLNPYDRTIEKNLRDKSLIEKTFIELSGLIGRERVLWRYDPVILNDFMTVQYHKEQFARLCSRLHAYTDRVTVSFAVLYPKLKTKLLRNISDEEIGEIGAFIGQTTKEYGLTAKACSEKTDLTVYGIGKASCIDKMLCEKICGCALDLQPDKNQRADCGCCESIDIGAYDTCPGGCVYCYANRSPVSAERRHRSHDPTGELLCGTAGAGEKITERKVKSNKK